MKTLHRAMVVLVLTVTLTYAAAPPGRWRALTVWENLQVNSMLSRLDRHVEKGEFEQAAKIAEEIAGYRAERQSKWHHEAIDARFRVEEYQLLKRVAAKDRLEIVRASKLNTNAIELHNKGLDQEAEKLIRQSLEIYKRVLGEQHRSTATSYVNLASILRNRGNVATALLTVQKAIDIDKTVLPVGHPDTALSYNELANCFADLDNRREALSWY